MTLEDWDEEDQLAALREGWIFSEANNGELQVQKVDDPEEWGSDFDIPALGEDADGWLILLSGNEPHHIKARQILKDTNPSDWPTMMEYFNTLKGNAS